MQFVDEAVIEAVAGDGGAGLVSFRREAHVPFGGPDGGDGGKGGDVVLEATTRVVTLLDHRYKRWYRADDGGKGGAKKSTGADGADIIVPVPLGTLVTDEATGMVLADMTEEGQRLVVAQGGRGGQGNTRFSTSTRQVPRFAQTGTPGESRTVQLNLKLVADIGLIGLPNAGKSTLIRSVTNSRARVGAYPFTTTVPNLGVYRLGDRDVVIADIPGLIEGAHEGHGLGDRFLKHIERTRVLIHLLSLSPDAADPVEAYRVVNHELAEHSAELATRPQLVVLNKIDLIGEREELELWRAELAAAGVHEVLETSGHTGENVDVVLRAAVKLLDSLDAEAEGRDPDDHTPEPWSPV